jgi:hypothetical protein
MSEPVWVPLGAAPLGGKELAYIERTTNLIIAATTEATSEVFITDTARDYDGQPIEIEFFSAVMEATQYCYLTLWDGETNLGGIANLSAAGGTESAPVLAKRKLVPTPGTHTYSIRAVRGTGSGAVYGGSGVGGYMPAYMRIMQHDVVPNIVPAGAPPLVTALPGSPVDGQEIILTNSLTAGTYSWHLRYVAARASNKWVFVGGSPMFDEITTAQGTASATYVALTTAGPSLTIPVAGDYLVEIGCNGAVTTATTVWMSYAIGATAAVDADAADSFIHGTRSSDIVRERKKLAIPAATVLAARYRSDGSNTGTFKNRKMRVTPVAVGG